MEVVGKSAAVWLGIAVLAVMNGLLREAVLKPRIGERIAHVTSTLLLTAAIIVISFVSQVWIKTASLGEAWLVSAGWFTATLAFEFLAGHYAFGNPWSKILADYDVRRGRVWLLVPTSILFSMPLAHVGLAATWLAPYVISNAVAATILIVAVARPVVARWLIVALFLYAGTYNIWLGLSRPQEYQGFAESAIIPWYRDFIQGPLRDSGSWMIPAIGVGQLSVACGGALGRRWLKAAMIGGCVFLLAIAPLGVGSACPFSFVVSLAAIVVASADSAGRSAATNGR